MVVNNKEKRLLENSVVRSFINILLSEGIKVSNMSICPSAGAILSKINAVCCRRCHHTDIAFCGVFVFFPDRV
jgi:hypothetical protein